MDTTRHRQTTKPAGIHIPESGLLSDISNTLEQYARVWSLTQTFIENNQAIIILLDNHLTIIRASRTAAIWLSPNNGVRGVRDVEGKNILDLERSKHRKNVYKKVANGQEQATAKSRNFTIRVQKIPGGLSIIGIPTES